MKLTSLKFSVFVTIIWRISCKLIGIVTLYLFSPHVVAGADSKYSANELALARDYVFAACIIDRYPGTPLALEADAWAGGLVEYGNLGASAYPQLAQWAKTAPKPSATRTGIEMRLQSCVDFVNSQGFIMRLRAIIKTGAR